jgi:hypothetical protein
MTDQWRALDTSEPLEVARGTEGVQGALRGGATVRSGATLVVQGVVGGPVVVESDALLIVQGAFSADAVHNEGSISLSGAVTTLPPGRVFVDVGTVIVTPGLSGRLLEDGTLAPLTEGQGGAVHVEATGAYCALTPDGRFHPVGDD